MNKFYTFFTLIASSLILVSFSSNPPDGKTGAPGEGICAECHTPANQQLNGEITVEGFPSAITPGQTYTLTVINRNTLGDAVRGGFQMTILGPFNTKAGEMTNPAINSTVTNTFGGRQYFEHNPSQLYPDSNAIKWTVDWMAPDLEAGSEITWYAAGNIANGNFQNTGDRIVIANGKGSIVLSSSEEITKLKPTLYPNPGNDEINVVLPDGTQPDGTGIFYALTGQRITETSILQGKMNTPDLPSGIYLIEIRQGGNAQFVRWSKI